MIVKGGVTGESSCTRSSLLSGDFILASARVQSGCSDIYLEAEYHRIDGHCFWTILWTIEKRKRKGLGRGRKMGLIHYGGLVMPLLQLVC